MANVTISCIATLLVLLTIVPSMNNIIVKIIAGAIGVLVTFVEGIRKYFKTSDMIAKHRSAAGAYNSIYKNVERNVLVRGSSGQGLRYDVMDFKDDYQTTFDTSPSAWAWVKMQYVTKYGKETNVTKKDLDGIRSIAEHPQDISKSSPTSAVTRAFMLRFGNNSNDEESL